MSTMDHAAAHERIEDLLLEPARLAALEASGEPDDVALREHLSECPTCRSDLETGRRLARALGAALPDTTAAAAAAVEPIEPPSSLRTRVIGAVHDTARSDVATVPARNSGLSRWAALAAVLVVAVGAVGVTVDQAGKRAAAEAEATALTNVVAAVHRVLASEHKVVPLRTAAGTDAGSISWSRHDWVVLTTGLTAPASEQRYKCWLEDSERTVLVGQMLFAGDTAYWVKSVDDWATWEIGPETLFVVTLEAADAQVRTGEPVLSADLGS
jgi:hypothetical protein